MLTEKYCFLLNFDTVTYAIPRFPTRPCPRNSNLAEVHSSLVALAGVMLLLFRSVLCLLVWLSCLCCAEYLKDEDVRLKIYSPESAQNSIALELVIFNRDEEFYVKIVSETDETICEGRFSRFSADRVKCSYDTSILNDGDNSFHVTIRSVATNEIVLDTTSHFFYEAGTVVPNSLSDNVSEYWEIVISIAIILLLFRYTPPALRQLKLAVFGPAKGGSSSPPPPPNLPIRTIVQDFNPLVPAAAPPAVDEDVPAPLPGRQIFRAVLLGAAILLTGKMVTAPFRGGRQSRQRAVQPPVYPVYAQPQSHSQSQSESEFVAQLDNRLPHHRPQNLFHAHNFDEQDGGLRSRRTHRSGGISSSAVYPAVGDLLHRSPVRGFGRIRKVSSCCFFVHSYTFYDQKRL